MKNFNNEFVTSLLNSKDYRNFLAKFFDKDRGQKMSSQKPLSYADFARRAGFSSRSFIRDVINGSKRVNLNNFEKICSGLKLTADLKDYFKALVAVEELDFANQFKIDPYLNLEKQSSKLKKSLALKRIDKTSPQHELRKLLLHSSVPLVFAASGTSEKGASFEEVKKKCKLENSAIEKALKELIRLELLSVREGRYYPCSVHVAIERLGGDEFFKIDFERSLSNLRKSFHDNPQHDLSLFLSSTFSVQEKNLPKLKESLNKLLINFINQYEEAEGDSLVNLVVGLTPN